MPVSEKQRRYFFSELSRKKKGQKTKMKVGKSKLYEMAHSPLEKEMSR